jgi:hypothetical protein
VAHLIGLTGHPCSGAVNQAVIKFNQKQRGRTERPSVTAIRSIVIAEIRQIYTPQLPPSKESQQGPLRGFGCLLVAKSGVGQRAIDGAMPQRLRHKSYINFASEQMRGE